MTTFAPQETCTMTFNNQDCVTCAFDENMCMTIDCSNTDLGPDAVGNSCEDGFGPGLNEGLLLQDAEGGGQAADQSPIDFAETTRIMKLAENKATTESTNSGATTHKTLSAAGLVVLAFVAM